MVYHIPIVDPPGYSVGVFDAQAMFEADAFKIF